MKEQRNERIERMFTYHAPKDNQPEMYEDIRNAAKDFAYLIDRYCPESVELAQAMMRLNEAVMWANASIARNE